MPSSASTESGRLTVLELVVSTALGGGPRHVYDLVRTLPREQFRVVVAAPPDGPFFERFRRIGCAVEPVPLGRLRPGTLRHVVRVVRAHRVDVIHSHGKGAGLYARLAGWWTAVPVVHTFHGIHYRKYRFGLGHVYIWLERCLSALSHAVIHVSASQARHADALRLAAEERTRVVVNGIDVNEVRTLAAREPLSRSTLGLAAGVPVLGAVARLDAVKGLDVLIEGLRRLSDRFPGAILVLVGSGDAEPALQDQAVAAGVGDRVVFAGAIPDAPRLFPALDVYVSASWGEGLPLALLEAMACELPIVATRVSGHVDVVVDGVTGFLVAPGDAADMAEKVARLLADPHLRREMGRAAGERVEREFRLDTMVAALAALYAEAAGTRRAVRVNTSAG